MAAKRVSTSCIMNVDNVVLKSRKCRTESFHLPNFADPIVKTSPGGNQLFWFVAQVYVWQ